MKSDNPTFIGCKYVGVGILSHIIVLLIIRSISGDISLNASGAVGITIMSVSVISAANEGYKLGAGRNASATEL